MKTSKTLIYSFVLIGLLSTFAQGATYTQLFFDDFTGTALDTSLWSVFVDAHGYYHWPYVAGGLLISQGYHTRIDSIPTFAPMGQSVMARVRIRLAGELHKFGFAVNPNERTGPITGYYFDTVDVEAQEHYVRALAWSNPGSGSEINLLDVEIPVTWYEFHEFAIERTPSEVIYSIDGNEVARVADAFADALPVGVWNDRWSLMQTDWVEVCSVELEPTVLNVDIKPQSCPNPLNIKSKGVLPVAILGSADFDVHDIDVATIQLAGVDPKRSNYEDVARPLLDADECECSTEEPDGYMDLTLKFNTQEIVCAIGPVADGDELVLELTGLLHDDTPITGADCIIIRAKGQK